MSNNVYLLHEAVRKHQFEEVKKLLEASEASENPYSIFERNEQGESALVIAARQGFADLLPLFSEKGFSDRGIEVASEKILFRRLKPL